MPSEEQSALQQILSQTVNDNDVSTKYLQFLTSKIAAQPVQVNGNSIFPKARVRKLMKEADFANSLIDGTEGHRHLISMEAIMVMERAAELFVKDLTARSFSHACKSRRRTLQKYDIRVAAANSPDFDFLIDVLPNSQERLKRVQDDERIQKLDELHLMLQHKMVASNTGGTLGMGGDGLTPPQVLDASTQQAVAMATSNRQHATLNTKQHQQSQFAVPLNNHTAPNNNTSLNNSGFNFIPSALQYIHHGGNNRIGGEAMLDSSNPSINYDFNDAAKTGPLTKNQQQQEPKTSGMLIPSSSTTSNNNSSNNDNGEDDSSSGDTNGRVETFNV